MGNNSSQNQTFGKYSPRELIEQKRWEIYEKDKTVIRKFQKSSNAEESLKASNELLKEQQEITMKDTREGTHIQQDDSQDIAVEEEIKNNSSNEDACKPEDLIQRDNALEVIEKLYEIYKKRKKE
ncbi:hypothetical protein [Natronincola ferrireducens]|uniref:Uncharacterized protein n=1 Tax=Natronincola ferrireducens TaxID=393762 RepID=A0A1G8YWR8_9FIRM|nr:hypothetical protein [Natronincola ferrireducens]SDK07299.1 hypothetical protein SAMN05660472_00671 [Natronincola ferrireducens]